jgi:crossover junction endodeoxyribonuclease RusA
MTEPPRMAQSLDRLLRAWHSALMPDVLTVTVGIPARTLSPNSRPHWSVKAKANKRARTESWAATQVAMYEADEKGGWGEATAQVHWYARDNRRRDKDNCLASLKPTFDGLVDAGLLKDDSALTHLPLVLLTDPRNPRVELILKRWDKGQADGA